MIDMKNITTLPSGKSRVRIEYREEILGGTFETVEEAVAVRDAIKRKIADGNLVPTKGSSAIDLGPRFLASRSGNRAVEDDEGRWHGRIAKASWARRPVGTVIRKDGMLWLEDLKKERTAYDPKIHGARPVKPISWALRRHCLNLARRFFQWCVDSEEILQANPFAGLSVEREDGDEDDGYQEEWFLDVEEQESLFNLWDTLEGLDARDRLEKWIYAFALWTGIRLGELCCLHLADVHVDGPNPHIVVRFGSWDPIKQRYRSPKGRKGEKRSRTIELWGLGLAAAKAWLEVRSAYLKMNPRTERERAARNYRDSGLMFPTERGRRRDVKPPRSWKKVIAAFGVVPRIGAPPWWHLLRHSCASALISGAWHVLYDLKEVQLIMGHTDIRTTQRYAHFAPSAMRAKAVTAHAIYERAEALRLTRHGAVTASRDVRGKPGISRHAREDSNLRPTAPEADGKRLNVEEIARRDAAVTAIRHVLEDVAAKRYVVPVWVVAGLETALDESLVSYAAGHAIDGEGRR